MATVTVSRSDVLIANGSNISWPPPKEINDDIAEFLATILEREWLGVFSIYP
jgi:hypothetical protein